MRRCVSAMAEHLPSWRWVRGEGGLVAWYHLPEPVSTALSATAATLGVLVPAGPRFGVDGAFERFVRLPYVREVEDLQIAAKRLAQAYAAVAPARGGAVAAPTVFV